MKFIDFEAIDSTNTYLKHNHNNLEDFTFVSAKYQSKGRGRGSRVWKSENGTNLLFSLLIKEESLINKFKDISIISAYSLIQVLEEKYGINHEIAVQDVLDFIQLLKEHDMVVIQ